MKMKSILVWFRRDLRVSDNPALAAAVATERPIVPVFIWAPEEESPWEPGAASCWWLHHSLVALRKQLESMGSRLLIRRGPTVQTLRELLLEADADSVYWNRLYEPALIQRDTALKVDLRDGGYSARSFNGALLFEPGAVQNQSGRPFQVFTPFWKSCLSRDEPDAPSAPPRRLTAPAAWPTSEAVGDLRLLPTIAWDEGLYETWTPGEASAAALLDRFADGAMAQYKQRRDVPAESATSFMSPHLHFGEIGPRQIWHRIQQAIAENNQRGVVANGEFYLREVGWREFAHHLLFHFPHTPEQPLRAEFADFPWRDDPDTLRAWQRGRTGYPIVDAGMRQLWRTGWMHNRVRMVVASFLVKHLLLPWQAGARWFWDTLVDADLANNTLGWQWAGGCGADAAPYFRIFNPMLQGHKFDQAGAYVRHWVPEVKDIPDDAVHEPWTAASPPPADRYPGPIVDHKAGRERALAALSEIKKT